MKAVLLLALPLAACSRAAQAPQSPQPAIAPDVRAAAAVADSVRRSYTQADVDFMSGMISHHAQAVLMARMAPSRGASSSVRILAERIINAQEDEIATMQQWLRDRGQPVPAADPLGMTMTMDGHTHVMRMPGMLTDEELAELGQAQGPAFDRLFLRYMIQHHQGAISMVEVLFGSQGAGQEDTIFKFASDVHVDQTTEIARMERMLDELPPGMPGQ